VRTTRAPVSYRDCTPAELEFIQQLNARVTFVPGSTDKRFVCSVGYDGKISEKQAAYLRTIVHRYRRQTGGCLNREHCLACIQAAK
jgi:hypothetical protein